MNILFVDDQPIFKVKLAIDYLKTKGIDFSFVIEKSVNSALRYINNHKNEIDLAVVDLGLPTFNDGESYGALEGLYVINFIYRKNPKIPIIINSSTVIPNEKEYLNDNFSDATIVHVPNLDLQWFEDYVRKLS